MIEDKIKIIDLICEKHPSFGVERGWSEYTGGMEDRGQWFFRVMLDYPINDLQAFLDGINYIQDKPIIPLTEQQQIDSKIIHDLGNGTWISEIQRKKLEEMKYNLENMIFGIKTNNKTS